MATEEFTFPIISGATCPSSIDSPPLWRLSPAASPDPHLETDEEAEDCFHQAKPKNYKQRKSCSDIDNSKANLVVINYKSEEDEDDQEEKMDVLWEDFNEELYNKSGSSRKDMVKLGCVQAFKLSKTNHNNNNGGGGGAIFSSSPTNNKPGVVLFIRVLKRIFLPHNHPHHHHHHQQKSVKNRIW